MRFLPLTPLCSPASSSFLIVFASATLTIACAESGALLSEENLRDQETAGAAGMTGDGGTSASGGAAGNTPSEMGIPSDCVFRDAENIAICAGTYLDVEIDSQGSVVQLPQGQIVVAAHVSASSRFFDGDASPNGPGALLVFDQAGREWTRLIWLGETVGPLEANTSGQLATWDGQRVLAFDESLAVAWSATMPNQVKRIDLASNGTVATLSEGGDVSVWDAAGQLTGTFTVQQSGTLPTAPLVHDLAISEDGTRIYVAGAQQDPSGGCAGMIPFLRAYDSGGQHLTSAYDFDAVGDNCASSEGLRVSLGADGLLYYAGVNHGGNTVHRLDPVDITTPAPLVSYDLYNQGYGKAIQRYGFVARFDPDTLAIQLGQFLIPRDSMDEGGEFLIQEIRADETGRVAIAARSTCCSPLRETTALEGVTPGPYAEAENSVVVLSPDFLERELWFTPTSAPGSSTQPLGLYWRDRILSVVTGAEADSSLFLHEAIQSSPAPLHLLTVPTP